MASTARNLRAEVEAAQTATETQATETQAPKADDWLGGIEEVSTASEVAPDARLIAMLRKSEAARVAGEDVPGYRFTVANKEVAKSRIAEIRRAGGVKYANCGVGIKAEDNKDGSVTILFKARKRRTSATGEASGDSTE